MRRDGGGGIGREGETRQYLFALPFSSYYSNKKVN